jgi:predicted enzyme related to lactoylglutathione lyase
MAKATGIGGVFFKTADVKATAEWYERCLGIEVSHWEGGSYSQFNWRDDDSPDRPGQTIWSPFKQSTEYFEPGGGDFMVNFRVDDLDGVLDRLRSHNVEIVGDVMSDPNGRFAWISDIDGRKVELWEPGATDAVD